MGSFLFAPGCCLVGWFLSRRRGSSAHAMATGKPLLQEHVSRLIAYAGRLTDKEIGCDNMGTTLALVAALSLPTCPAAAQLYEAVTSDVAASCDGDILLAAAKAKLGPEGALMPFIPGASTLAHCHSGHACSGSAGDC